jgi:energy-coupling factor transporter ATP-binding protein EcfA2
MQELVSDREYLRGHGLDFTFRLSCCRNGDAENGAPHLHAPPVTISNNGVDREHAEALETDSEALVRMRDYRYRYPDGTWGIRDVGFTVKEGESVAILGENGAGKSTLVSCMAGIIQGRGEYFFEGKPVSGSVRKGLWQHIGIVFQDPSDQLFCPSCREEVAFGLKQLRFPVSELAARVEESLALVGLEGFEERVPHNLSFGERKRLALASVLCMRPRVLILDEPTANLDPQNEELFCAILQRLAVTKILISHDMDVISLLCERVLVMHHGRLIRDYSAAAFLRDEHLVSINGLDYTFRNACCREIIKLQGEV